LSINSSYSLRMYLRRACIAINDWWWFYKICRKCKAIRDSWIFCNCLIIKLWSQCLASKFWQWQLSHMFFLWHCRDMKQYLILEGLDVVPILKGVISCAYNSIYQIMLINIIYNLVCVRLKNVACINMFWPNIYLQSTACYPTIVAI
jgi:hypothetical protein